MLKVVVDTNTFTSALLNPGVPRTVVSRLRQRAYQVFYPQRLIIELRALPFKRKFKGRITVPLVERLIRLIEKRAHLVDTKKTLSISRDPDDNDFLVCGEVAACNFLVSGDGDLLDLHSYATMKIVNARQFLNILTKQK